MRIQEQMDQALPPVSLNPIEALTSTRGIPFALQILPIHFCVCPAFLAGSGPFARFWVSALIQLDWDLQALYTEGFV